MIYLNKISCLLVLIPMLSLHNYVPVNRFLSKYKIKSAVVHYKSLGVIPIQKETTLYFDEFGKKEMIKVDDIVEGVNRTLKLINIDSLQFMMMDSIQCIKANRKKKFSFDNIDMSLIDEKVTLEYGIKNVGKVIFLEQECNKYIFDNQVKKITGEIIEWRNIPLAITIVNNGGMTQTMTAYKIESGNRMSAGIFELPKGIEILDMTSVDNN
jgi:hypothetical protein